MDSRQYHGFVTNIMSCHKVSTKIKEYSEVAYFGANFALTEVYKNPRDRKSEVWSMVYKLPPYILSFMAPRKLKTRDSALELYSNHVLLSLFIVIVEGLFAHQGRLFILYLSLSINNAITCFKTKCLYCYEKKYVYGTDLFCPSHPLPNG